MGDPGVVVEHAVLGDVQAAPHREVAQRNVVILGSGEVLEHVAELVGLDDPEVDVHARVRPDPDRVGPGVRRGLDLWQRSRRLRQRAGVGGGRDDVEVLDALGHATRRAGELGVDGRRMRSDLLEQLLADRQRAVQHDALRRARLRVGVDRLEQRLLGLRRRSP